MTSAGPIETLSGRSYRDFRQLFDRVFSLAGEGRVTFEILRELAGELLRFFACRTVEIACDEHGRRLRALAAEGSQPLAVVWRARTEPSDTILRSLETLPAEVVRPLEAERRRAPDRRRLAWLFPPGEDKNVRSAVLMIPSGRAIVGAVCMSFGEPRKAGASSLDLLTRLASILGRSLSHNRSRFELRERGRRKQRAGQELGHTVTRQSPSPP